MDLPVVVNRYARRFAAGHCIGHSVSSPLGAWLVLAAAAQAAPEGELRDEIEDLIGLDVSSCANALDELLRDPPSVVVAALAAWGFDGADWAHRLPGPVEIGRVPTQTEADAWARERTLGLIDRFPLGDISSVDGLLASAVATRVSWAGDGYELADARELHSPWSTQVTQVLESELGNHGGYLSDTEQAGIVGVHAKSGMYLTGDPSNEGALRVVSVIADAGVNPVDVLAAAHDIAIAEATRDTVPRQPLFDMPLGDGTFWTITEEPALGGGEHGRAFLPAWRAQSNHDLMADPALGFGLVARAAVAAGGNSSPKVFDAVQAAVAGYGQYGFEAGALNGIAIGGEWRKPAPARVITLRFGHPYAVVAVARGGHHDGHPWNGVPVFTAWVTEPSEAAEVTAGRFN